MRHPLVHSGSWATGTAKGQDQTLGATLEHLKFVTRVVDGYPSVYPGQEADAVSLKWQHCEWVLCPVYHYS